MNETARLRLRAPCRVDANWFAENMNTPAVTQFLAGVRAQSEFAERFERDVVEFAESGLGFFCVELRTGGLVGKCGLASIGSPLAPAELQGQVQIGWSLAEPFWGRGLAFEAAQAVLDHGFGERRHQAIFAQTSDSNRASTGLMLRLGFARMETLDYTDPDYPPTENPTTVYRLGRNEWAAR